MIRIGITYSLPSFAHDSPVSALTERIISDTGPFVPYRTGRLCSSVRSEVSSDRTACIIWDTPYASRVYSGDTMNFSHEKHPSACSRWAEVSAQYNMPEWEKLELELITGEETL